MSKLFLRKRTKFQELEILQSPVLGLCLLLDGLIQVAEVDECRYHETLVHSALLRVGEPRRVAIIGGGDGCAAREVLKHKAVDEVDLVDLDRQVVDASKKYLTTMNKGSLSNPKVRLHFTDGREYLSEKEKVYDAILLDATDPTEGGPSLLLYSREFYSIARTALRQEGVLITQATAFGGHQFRRVFWTIRSVFKRAEALHVFVGSFYDDWGFVMTTRSGLSLRLPSRDAREIEHEARRRINGELRYLNGRTYLSNFALPTEQSRRLLRHTPIIRDREALAAKYKPGLDRKPGPSPWAFG